jgi:hypothetical protein
MEREIEKKGKVTERKSDRKQERTSERKSNCTSMFAPQYLHLTLYMDVHKPQCCHLSAFNEAHQLSLISQHIMLASSVNEFT